MLSSLSDEELDYLAGACAQRVRPAQSQIFSPSAEADRFFIILSGRVKIYKISPRGEEQILHLYGPGDTFAEAAMLAGIRYPAHAETTEDSILISIDRKTLSRMIDKNPDLAMRMMAGLCEKLHEFNRLIEHLSLREVPARLASALLEMPAKAGTDTVRLDHTKRQLAARLGTAPETLSRALARMKSEGLIEVKGSEITILDPDRLEKLARE